MTLPTSFIEDLRGRVTDVLDGVRYDVVGFPLPGRSFFASLELRLDPR